MYYTIMTKRNKILLVIAILILPPVVSFAINPLHRSSDKIRNRLLKKTEIGLAKDKVKEIGKSRLNLILKVDEYGPPDRDLVKQFREIDHNYLEAELGSHYSHDFLIFRTYVYAYWVFDKNDILLDVLIYKETDAL